MRWEHPNRGLIPPAEFIPVAEECGMIEPIGEFVMQSSCSQVARWQAEWVASRLTERGTAVELVPITTQGDVKSGPLGQIGGQGLFTKELQRALLEREIDLAVHSLKDLPTAAVEGLSIAAVPERESTADVLISPKAERIEALGIETFQGDGQSIHDTENLQVIQQQQQQQQQ